MEIKIKGRTQELKFTFNSFKYMEDMNFGEMEDFEKYPIKFAGMVKNLLLGAVNNNPRNLYSESDVMMFLEDYCEENDLGKFAEELFSLLSESSFFKSLQR